MMKKNILILVIVIGVMVAVVYLLKDRLKALLGERAQREEPTGIPKIGLADPLIGLPQFRKPPGPLDTMEAAFKEPTAIYEYVATWIGADIVGVVREIYPPFPEHGPVLKSLVTYKKGEAIVLPVPPTNGFGLRPKPDVEIQLKKFETFGPYSYGLPQF